MMPSFFTVYKYVFVITMTIAQLIFVWGQEKRKGFLLRASSVLILSFLVAALFPTVKVDALYCSVMFTVFFLINIPMTKFCFDVDWRYSLFCSVAAYSSQHMASILYNLIVTVGGFNNAAQIYSNDSAVFDPLTVSIFVEVYALTYLAVYHAFARKLRHSDRVTITRPAMLGILVLMMVVEIVLNAFVVYRQNTNLDLVYFVSACLTNLLCSLAVLIILFGQLLQKTLEDELAVMDQMWRQERKQYQISKDTIDMINIKCHDMKHQLHAIRNAATIDPQALKEMEQNLDIYDTIVKTGNEALDIILAEKGLSCQKFGIAINCIIDGEKLSFMSDMDVYSLFGNLMDNAMNSAMNVEMDKRIISIAVKARNDLLSINFHNYYVGEVLMAHGMPITRSEDKKNHGFGIKSIKFIVARYGGEITFTAANQIFTANILLPIPALHQEVS